MKGQKGDIRICVGKCCLLCENRVTMPPTQSELVPESIHTTRILFCDAFTVIRSKLDKYVFYANKGIRIVSKGKLFKIIGL